MRNAVAATVAVLAVLVAANMLGVASAEAPTTTTTTTSPGPSVSVEGVATVPIAQAANLAAATSAYREGTAAAIADGHTKAEFLAGKAGATLGAVQSILEDGGSIQCTGAGEEESDYVAYQGEQPDFGSVSGSDRGVLVAAPESSAAGAPALGHRKKAKKRVSAKKASTTSCTLSAQVTLVYAIS